MKGVLLLAWRYLAFHRVRSGVLVVGVALTVFLPLAVELLVARYSASLAERAAATPLVLGAPGSRYDLVLSTLYFQGRTPRPLAMDAVERAGASGLAAAVPLFVEVTADGLPVVGTTPEYYGLRGLAPAAGGLPVVLGECALGARAARELGLGPGDALLTDRARTYDLAAGYPLLLRVVGVLAETRSADDGAVFCDLKTAWIAAGIGHGHGDARAQEEGAVLRRDTGGVVLNAAVVEYTEITPDNLDDFHFHGASDALPVTGAIVLPADARARTKLLGRYRLDERAQLLVPADVMAELLGVVFRVKVFFDANAALVLVATSLFLAVIVALSLALRRRERLTLFKIGCARRTVLWTVAAELGLLLGAGGALAAAGALVFVRLGTGGLPL